MITEQQLLRKKKEIETAKSELSELIGQEKQLRKQLKDDWGCSTLQEAKKKIENFQKEAKEMETEIQEKTEILEDKYF